MKTTMLKKLFPVVAAAFLAGGAYGAHARMALPPAQEEKPAATPVFFDSIMQRLFGNKQQEAAQSVEYYINSDESFEENTRTDHFRPFNDQYLEFDLPVPRNWQVEDLTKAREKGINNSIVGDIVTMESEMISVYKARVVISLQPLMHEISASTWLKNHVFTNGYALQGEVEAASPYRASAYYTSINDAKNLYSYLSVQVSGNLAMLARFESPLPMKEHIAFLQKKLVDSIALSYPREEAVEPQKSYTLSDAFKFNYPTSWGTQSAEFKEPDKPTIEMVNISANGTIDGFIRLQAVRRSKNTTLVDEIKNQQKYFNEHLKIDATKMVHIGPVKESVTKRFLFTRYEVYEAAYQKAGLSNPELRFAILGDKEWYIFVILLTPREQDNLPNWGRNVRTFEVILKSIR